MLKIEDHPMSIGWKTGRSSFWPETATKLGLTEPETDVDATFLQMYVARPFGT